MNYYFMGGSYLDYKDELNIIDKSLDVKKLDFKQLNIFTKGSPKISIDEKNKLITINILNSEDKVIIDNSSVIDWNIKIFAPKNNIFIEPESRYDLSLLTSIMTIQDSNHNINIDINGGELEDSLNIIRSEGNINKINISNSFQDAVDFDFSNLKVDEVNIFNAGERLYRFFFGFILYK